MKTASIAKIAVATVLENLFRLPQESSPVDLSLRRGHRTGSGRLSSRRPPIFRTAATIGRTRANASVRGD